MAGVCARCKLTERYKYWNEPPPTKHKFFKIMTADFEQQLRFPKKFIECFKGKLARECTLKGPSGNEWQVRIKKTGKGDFVLSTGWEKFVIDNGLNRADFLTFKYLGDSSFKVSIFDATGCEREGSHYARNFDSCSYTTCTSTLHADENGGFECLSGSDEEPDHSVEEGGLAEQNSEGSSQELNMRRIRGRERNQSKSTKRKWESVEMPKSKGKKKRLPSYEDLDESGEEVEAEEAEGLSYGEDKDEEWSHCSWSNKRREESRAKQPKKYYISNRRGVTEEEKERAYNRAMAYMKIRKPSGVPMFALTMCQTHVYCGFNLTIPKEWALKHMLLEPAKAELKVPGEMENWHVGCRWTPSQCQIRAKWPRFVLENNLEEHDVCVFELIQKGMADGERSPVFLVNIFRVVDETIPLKVARGF